MATTLTVAPVSGEPEYLSVAAFRDAATQTCALCDGSPSPAPTSAAAAAAAAAAPLRCTCRASAADRPSAVLIVRDAAGHVVGAVVRGVLVTSAAVARNAAYIAANTTLGGGVAGLPGAFAGLATSTFWAALSFVGLAARGTLSLGSAAARYALGYSSAPAAAAASASAEASASHLYHTDGRVDVRISPEEVADVCTAPKTYPGAAAASTRVSTGVQVMPDLSAPRRVPVARIVSQRERERERERGQHGGAAGGDLSASVNVGGSSGGSGIAAFSPLYASMHAADRRPKTMPSAPPAPSSASRPTPSAPPAHRVGAASLPT